MITKPLRWMQLAALAAVFVISSCRVAPSQTPTIAPTSTSLPGQTSTPTKTPVPLPTPTPLPSPTVQDCPSQASTLKDDQITSKYLGEALQFRVYLPPCYTENPAKPYPVLYLLHGQQQDATLWENLGAIAAVDSLIQSGKVEPFLIVMPTERHFLLDLKDTDYDQAIAEDLIPAIDEEYPTCRSGSCRAIGGISRGGAWAVRIGFSYPQEFHFIGAHSPAVFGGDLSRLPTLLREFKPEDIPEVYLDTGRTDDYRESAITLEGILTQLGVPHEWHLNEGQHNSEYWLEHMAEYVLWYGQNWR